MTVYGNKIFKNPIEIITAFNSLDVQKAFEKIEKLKEKYFLTGYCRYEMRHVFEDGNFSFAKPLLYFEVYENFEEFLPDTKTLPEKIRLNPIPTIDFENYAKAIEKIKQAIANGNTYEVNYTLDFDVEYEGDSLKLFEYLLQKQPTPYNAFFENEFDTILSFSPELFFELEKSKITTRPMKGTIRRGRTNEEDLKNIEFLKNDVKNRAENVMIVDLLRNDLGRIAKTGSVKVEKLFEIETHSTLHQMTSKITAEIREEVSLYDIFKSIFPCGSITGAPKVSTMKIIDEIEKGNRNIYCGAIGFLSPEKCIFSVPIRILQRETCEKTTYKYRAGGAIVWDSTTTEEWDEVLTKSKFLLPDFKLVETMRVENGKILFEKEHFERLSKSAEFFGFPAPSKTDFRCEKNSSESPEKLSEKRAENFEFERLNDGILRILYSKDGNFEHEFRELKPNLTNKIIFSDLPVQSRNIFLYHKTDFKPWFEGAYEKIRKGEVFDVIFFNEKGEITEGARSNIIIQKGGKLFTPPVSSGRLDGIYLNSMENIFTKILYKNDLENADKIFCVNSVRGCVEVEF